MTLGAEQLLNLVALAAALVARHGIADAARRSPVAARLRLVYGLVAALLALRLGHGLWPAKPVVAALMIAAAWLPYATLRLAEEIVRRHAPRLVKIAALAGSLIFSLFALTLGLVWSGPAIAALAGFQAAMTLCVILLLTANRRSVSPAERQAADMVALALALSIPLALTDFRLLFPGLPVRGGAFALLVLVLAASRLSGEDARPRMLIADLLLVAAGGGATALFLAVSASEGWRQALLPVGAGAAAMLALAMLVERVAMRRDTGPDIVGALARVPADAGRQALLAAHPMLSRGIPVSAAALADFPQETLAALARYRMISADTLEEGSVLGDAARDLLQRHAATHLLRLSVAPPCFLAVSAGGLADARTDEELEVAARLLEGVP